MLRSIYVLVIALTVLILSGCASTAAKRTERGVELDFTSEKSQGFVVLKVIATQPVSLMNPKWQSIKVTKDGRSVDLPDITPYANMFTVPAPTESLYFAKLDAGTYDVTGLDSIGPGPGLLLSLITSDNTSFKQALPRFEVVAGKLANLGTIIYAPEIEKIRSERMFLLDGAMGKQSAKDTLLAESTQTNVPVEEGGGWAKTSTSEAAVLNEARNSISMLSILPSSQGVIAGSHLGQIFKRSAPQTWSKDTIGTLDRVLALTETTDGKLIAGSQYGKYFVKNGDQAWTPHQLADVKGHIRAIHSHNGSTFFVVQDIGAVRILQKKNLELRNDTPIEIWKSKEIFSTSIAAEGEIVIAQNEPGIMREVVLTRINMNTLAISTKKENFWVATWQYLPNKEVKLARQNGLSLYLSSSIDNMHTWVNTDLAGGYGTYWLDATNAYSFEISAGMVTVESKLRKTNDAGKTWKTQGSELRTRHFSGQIVFADEREILVQGANMLYSTINQGESWQRIFPTQ